MMQTSVLLASRLANQDPAVGLPGEYIILAVRVLAGATHLPPATIRAWLDEVVRTTNADPALTPRRPVTTVDVAKVWLASVTTFPALLPVEQRRAVAAYLGDGASFWERLIASCPLGSARC
jgi:hypothetical protein